MGIYNNAGVSLKNKKTLCRHEIGHSWGAEHDPEDTSCAPSDADGGHYIMYAAATDGSRTNNNQFSTCSTASMASVIGNANCLSQASAYCGNGIVESGEVCDCGLGCTETSCCTTSCTINTDAGYTCAPQNPIAYPCCTAEDGSDGQCQIVTSDAEKLCDFADECIEDTMCDGSTAYCPSRNTKADGTECDCFDENCQDNPGTGSKICSGGMCNTWLCTVYGAARCVPRTEDCALYCVGDGWGNGTECVSTFDTEQRHPSVEGTGVYLGEGATCDDYRGYCSRDGRCHTVGSDTAGMWAKGGLFFRKYGWMLFVGCGVLVTMHYGFRRMYRVPRRKAGDYDMLDNDERTRFNLDENGSPLYVMGRGSPSFGNGRNEFAQWESSSSEDDDMLGSDVDDTLEGGSGEVSVDQIAAEYDRQRQQVVLNKFSAKISRAMYTETLVTIGKEIAALREQGTVDTSHTMAVMLTETQLQELRVAYVDRLNVLQGHPPTKKSVMSKTADGVFEIVDSTRGAAANAWQTTKEKTRKLHRSMKRASEKDAENYLYF